MSFNKYYKKKKEFLSKIILSHQSIENKLHFPTVIFQTESSR